MNEKIVQISLLLLFFRPICHILPLSDAMTLLLDFMRHLLVDWAVKCFPLEELIGASPESEIQWIPLLSTDYKLVFVAKFLKKITTSGASRNPYYIRVAI